MSKIFNKVVMSETAPSVNDLWLNKGKISYFSNGWNTLVDLEGDKNYDVGKGLILNGNELNVCIGHDFGSVQEHYSFVGEGYDISTPLKLMLKFSDVGLVPRGEILLYDIWTNSPDPILVAPAKTSRALVTERALKAQLDKVRKEVVPGLNLHFADGSGVSIGAAPEYDYHFSSVMGIFEEI